MAAQTELPKIECMQRFNEEKCLSSILLIYRSLMCMIIVFDVHFHVFPPLILFWFVFGEGDTNTEKWSTWGKSGTLYLKVEGITYALGMSLKNPEHAYLTIPSPQILQIKSIIHLQMFISLQKQVWHRPWCWKNCSCSNPHSQCPQWKFALLFWSFSQVSYSMN